MTVPEGVAVRSWLYVPGDDADKLSSAAGRGADALILDLEDAVAKARRPAARELVVEWLRQRPRGPGPAAWVRVNNDSTLADDLRVIAGAGPDGILVPKADLASMSRAGAIVGREVPLGALVETAQGVLDVATVARMSGVARLAIGEADLAAELGLEPSADGREMWPLRSQIVVASAAAGIEPPCGPVSTDFRDLGSFRSSTEALRRAGFGSRSAIHPAQVPVINEVFTPSTDEVRRAEMIVAAHEKAVADGNGVTLDGEGRMVDEAVIRSARRILTRAQWG